MPPFTHAASSLGHVGHAGHHVDLHMPMAHPPMALVSKLAADVGTVFSPYGRPISAYMEIRAVYPALRTNVHHAIHSDRAGSTALSQPTHHTASGAARAFGQICSPRSAKSADRWSTAVAVSNGELGDTVRNAIGTIPLPLPTKVGLFAASYGVDILQNAYERDPERTSRQMFATGSDFSNMP